jgi:hypothetical protein
MEDIFPKYIIEDGALIISNVTYHKEMVIDKTKVSGGGWFVMNNEHKTLLFRSYSADFGRATLEDVKKCVEDKKVYTNPFSEHDISDQYKIYYETESGEIIPLN